MKKLALLFMLSIAAWGQVTVVQAPVPKFRSFLSSGSPNVGGCVYTFASGTSTPQATYFDFTGLTPNSNPVILDGNGEAQIWITSAVYRFQVWSFGSGVIGSNCGNGQQLYQIDGVRDTGLNALNGPLTIAPTTNGIDILTIVRATDVSPSGNFVNFKSLAGSTLFKVDIAGNVVASGGGAFSGAVSGTTGTFSGAVSGASVTSIKYTDDGSGNFFIIQSANPAFRVHNGGVYAFSSTATASGSADTGISRGAANQVNVGNGTFGDATGTLKDTITNSLTGYQVNGTATASHCLVGNGTNYVDGSCPSIVGSANQTAQAANISATTIITPGSNGFYRISCTVMLTQAAGTSSTLPQCQYFYTDGDSSVAQTINVTNTTTANSPGSQGSTVANPLTFFAKSGVAIQYGTTGYVSSGSPVMQYAIHVRLEGPF